MEFNERLFQAIKKDDVKEFESCMSETHCCPLRLGRFPTLSVMYMYNAGRLLRIYEKNFLKCTTWQDIGEPMELSAKFRTIAGKCLRLYLNETVSPVEMLLLLNNNFKLKKVFPLARAAAPVRQRLKDIYYIRWGLQAQFVRNKIVLQRRPMTRVEKLRWLTRAMCAVLCVAIVVSMPFVVNAFAPFIADENGVVNVNKWEQIKFGSTKNYALTKDVTVPSNYFAKELNCNLDGNGHKVTVTGNGVFGDINGKLTDIVFETNGSPLAENVTLSAEVDNVTVNATVNVSTDKAIGFFANNNYGTITNVVVNATGSLYATATEGANTFMCGGIVATNYYTDMGNGTFQDGVLKDCIANYNDFSLHGQLEADASFGGIAGKNDANIEGCKTSGEIFAETFDVAGVCSENTFFIVQCVNEANITQQTELAGWNPIATGIVINNLYVVDRCENTGAISSVSTAPTMEESVPTVYAAGIAYQSAGEHSTAYVQFCTNSGDISATATQINANTSGICNVSSGYVSMCVNSGKVNADGAIVVNVGGVTGVSYGFVYYSVNNGEIFVESQQEAHVGGIVGTSYGGVIRSYNHAENIVITSYLGTIECHSTGNIEVTGKVCYVGGISGYSMYIKSAEEQYCGIVDDCIAECEVNVTTTSTNNNSAVGGIVGRIETANEQGSYAGGHVGESFFVGKLQVTQGVYAGAIVGAMDENVYISSKSAEEQDKQGDLHDNVYADDCDVNLAYGAVFAANGSVNTYDDVGARKSTRSQIVNDTVYIDILNDIFEQLNSHE